MNNTNKELTVTTIKSMTCAGPTCQNQALITPLAVRGYCSRRCKRARAAAAALPPLESLDVRQGRVDDLDALMKVATTAKLPACRACRGGCDTLSCGADDTWRTWAG